MPRKIDFKVLSLKDALDLAILVEEEAKERYEEFVDQMQSHHNPEAADFFRFMAFNEAKHGEQLAFRRHSMFPDEPRAVTREMLWDVEAPDYDRTRLFMTARQAMMVALDSEVKAHDYFEQALNHVADPEVRGLFDELRREEIEHQNLVKKQLDKMPAETGVNPEDYADGPVAQ
jgi:erythrin-vacuolar iron transport family protein